MEPWLEPWDTHSSPLSHTSSELNLDRRKIPNESDYEVAQIRAQIVRLRQVSKQIESLGYNPNKLTNLKFRQESS